MNSTRKIILLSFVVSAIIGFWLMPLINKAEQTTYVRYYEDTGDSNLSFVTFKNESDTTGKKGKKVYRKETIEPRKKVSAKMFSRAVQFEPVKEDSIQEVHAKTATTKSAKKE